MQNNFVGPPIPGREKNIVVNMGIPWGGPSYGPGTNIFLPPGGDGRAAGLPAWVRHLHAQMASKAKAKANADAEAAKAAEAARLLAQRHAEETAQLLAQQHAAEVARLLAQQQAAEVARQLAHRQAEEAARQIAQQQAEAMAMQIAQQQAEAAAHQIVQQQAEDARNLEAKANGDARAQTTLQRMIDAPVTTSATHSAAKALEAVIKIAALRLVSSTGSAMVPMLAALYPSELGNGDLRSKGENTTLSPPGINALGPTTLPEGLPLPQTYPDGRAVANPSQNETLPGVDPADANASILGYPADEDLPSPEVMDSRTTPGIASGYRTPSNGTWLGENTRGEGAPIPSQIADSLRGQRFENFDRMREAIWKAVANDPELSKQFKKANIEEMKAGRSPSALADDHAGKRMKFEMHHKHWIVNGGEVYGMDNLVILGPRQHIEIHKGNQS